MRLKPWKMKPICLLRMWASCRSVQLGDVHAVQVVVPIGGDVQAAQDIHEGGLAGAGLADDGHEFSPVDGEGDAVQCANLALLPLVVDFKEVFYINEHTGALFNSTFRRGSGSR